MIEKCECYEDEHGSWYQCDGCSRDQAEQHFHNEMEERKQVELEEI